MKSRIDQLNDNSRWWLNLYIEAREEGGRKHEDQIARLTAQLLCSHETEILDGGNFVSCKICGAHTTVKFGERT